VQDGKIVFNPKTSGFTENKIIKDRGQRSAIGITKSNKLLLVTGSNLNMNELSKVMVELGAVKAMNLDGGASSGLYAKGNMITNPGRKLNTVLMIYNK
jgi:exopolysaccharide biosynthesis protein